MVKKLGKRIGEETNYIPGAVNTGVFRDCIIDTSWDITAYEGWVPEFVLITHGHADHFRLAYLLRQRGARIGAPREEALLIERPEINIRAMFSWAWPPEEMVTSFFKGTACRVDFWVENWHYPGITPIPLPGHSVAQVGYLTEDGVLFSGDALYTRELWKEFPLPYSIDPGLVRDSLKRLKLTEFQWLVPGHGKPLTKEQSVEEIESHLAHLDRLDEMILYYLQKPRSTEEIISDIYTALQLKNSLAQYWLAVTVIKAHLSYLHRKEQVRFFLDKYRVYWEAIA
ncbi:MAG: Uncharacterized protein XD63_1134 [Thermoanaerobacterales bacterium 50_218]|nr:MAG: Uncharacterized protein XD63_1134 [Thermoanaerobacterales bacterium 50_218]HAA90137.1 MBL fold metallo-hydrolase [Peptococcaceae bacterium]